MSRHQEWAMAHDTAVRVEPPGAIEGDVAPNTLHALVLAADSDAIIEGTPDELRSLARRISQVVSPDDIGFTLSFAGEAYEGFLAALAVTCPKDAVGYTVRIELHDGQRFDARMVDTSPELDEPGITVHRIREEAGVVWVQDTVSKYPVSDVVAIHVY